MDNVRIATFDTPLGVCGLAWSERGLRGVQLPERSAAATLARLLRRFPGAQAVPPSRSAQAIIDGIVALLGGAPVAFDGIELDDADIAPFDRRVYAVARAIGPGATLTYGEVAARIGEPKAARAVGRALGDNPFAIVVPCHRVLAAGGRIGGFSAGGGAATKRRLLEIERARVGDAPDLFADERRAPPVGRSA